MDRGSVRKHTAMVGVDVLGLVTTGMYIDPLAVYREYVQNAADAIQSAGLGNGGLVKIAISAQENWVAVRDNGPGLTFADAERALVAIANSEKRGRGLRGFRGIGRLAGLAFAETVTFLTRAGRNDPVVRVVWDRNAINAAVENRDGLADVVDRAVSLETVAVDGFPERFFEARLDRVARHASSSMMNRDRVRRYIGEVCPVQFSSDFGFDRKILETLGVANEPFTVAVRLDGEDTEVERPHARSVRITEQDSQEIVEIEEIQIAGIGAREYAAIGWIAHTAYRGAISNVCGVRGIRARVGNMQIGGEDVFAHLFSEDRFNRWCIAEVHVLDPCIVPNARRDYFEPSAYLRNFENQLGAVCRGLEKRCRDASKERLSERRLSDFLDQAEGTLELVASGYLDEVSARKLIEKRVVEAESWKQKGPRLPGGEAGSLALTLNGVVDRLSGEVRIGATDIPGVGMRESQVYREVFGVLADVLGRPDLAKSTIEAILDRMRERRATRGRPAWSSRRTG